MINLSWTRNICHGVRFKTSAVFASNRQQDVVMPRFFFDITDGTQTTLDRLGVDLEDPAKARVEATRTLSEIASQELPNDGPARTFKISVSDEQGKVLFEVKLDFSTIETEADSPGDGRGS
jgi:hypothetical protein